MDEDTIACIANSTGMTHCRDFGDYLGVLIHSSRVSKQTYRGLLEKVQNRLSSWKSKQLSLAGRATLVQSVTNTVANYTMQTSKLPVAVANEIDALNRHFLWGGSDDSRKVPLVKWDTVCRPKSEGGLGLIFLARWQSPR